MAHGTSKHLLMEALFNRAELKDIGQHASPTIFNSVESVERDDSSTQYFNVTGKSAEDGETRTKFFKTID